MLWKDFNKDMMDSKSPGASSLRKTTILKEKCSPILMDGERVQISIIVDYLLRQIPSLCQSVAEYRFKDAEIGLSMTGTTKSYFSMLDNIKSPLLLWVLCEDIYYQFHAVDVYDDEESRKHSSSMSLASLSSSTSFSTHSTAALNLSAVYFQILKDLTDIHEMISSQKQENDQVFNKNSPDYDDNDFNEMLPSSFSCSSNFSFISLNSTQSNLSQSPFSVVLVDDPHDDNDNNDEDSKSDDNNDHVSNPVQLEHIVIEDYMTMKYKESDDGDSRVIGDDKYSVLLHMLDDLVVYIGMRITLINIYKSLRSCGSREYSLTPINSTHEDQIQSLNNIEQEIQNCHHIGFASSGFQILIQEHISHEIKSLKSILKARVSLLSGQYVDSILSCQELALHINQWKKLQMRFGHGSSHGDDSRRHVDLRTSRVSNTSNSSSVNIVGSQSIASESSDRGGVDYSTALRWTILCQQRFLTLISFLFQERRKKTITLIGGGASEEDVLTADMFQLSSSLFHSGENEDRKEEFGGDVVTADTAGGVKSSHSTTSLIEGFDNLLEASVPPPRTRRRSTSTVFSDTTEDSRLGRDRERTQSTTVTSSSDAHHSPRGSAPNLLFPSSAKTLNFDPVTTTTHSANEEILLAHAVDAFYLASQSLYSRSILLIVCMAESPAMSSPEEARAWIIQQNQGYSCPPSAFWHMPMDEPGHSNRANDQEYQYSNSPLYRQTGVVVQSKLWPSHRTRQTMKTKYRARRKAQKNDNNVSGQPTTTNFSRLGLVANSNALAPSNSSSDLSGTVSSNTTTSAVPSNTVASTSTVDGGSIESIDNSSPSTVVSKGQKKNVVGATKSSTTATAMPAATASDQGSTSNRARSSSGTVEEDDDGGETLGTYWIQQHLQGIGEIISSRFSVQTTPSRRRRSASSNRPSPEYRVHTPPREPSPNTDLRHSGRSVMSNINYDDQRDDDDDSYDSDGYDEKYAPYRNSIRTSCGVQRSAGYHFVQPDSSASSSTNAAASTGCYFFAPLNDIHMENVMNSSNRSTSSHSTPRSRDSKSNHHRNRLFLVGGMFQPISKDNDLPATSFTDTMLEHLLSIGTFLRGDDLFVDVGKTKRHN